MVVLASVVPEKSVKKVTVKGRKNPDGDGSGGSGGGGGGGGSGGDGSGGSGVGDDTEIGDIDVEDLDDSETEDGDEEEQQQFVSRWHPDDPTVEIEDMDGHVPTSNDPNEMAGPLGDGNERLLRPGEWTTYTVFFENKSDATGAAQEVRVTAEIDPSLDWESFELGEVSFGGQIDTALSGLAGGESEVKMASSDYFVRTEAGFDANTGRVFWYLRIVDKTTSDGWPRDAYAGILPPNDPETHCGEGHITYRVKVREDAEPGARIDASATIVFDYNDPIETDPAWWNTVGTRDVPLPVWRFYSKNYKGHFFTISEEEKDGLIATNPNWNFEGRAYAAFTNEAPATVPLYRFYSKGYRGHFFTIDEEEMRTVRDTNPNWKYEGVAYYVYPEEIDGSVPVFLFWSKGYRHHFYTTDVEERDTLIATNPNWAFEGTAFWALPLGDGGSGGSGGGKASSGAAATAGTPVPVPHAWLDSRAASAVAARGEDREAAAMAIAANGRDLVWQCYVSGIDPEDPDARFEARLEFDGGEPVVKWSPDLSDAAGAERRVYSVEGKETLSGEWGPTNSASRFFRVKAALP